MLTHGLKVTDFMPSDSNEEVDIVIRFEKIEPLMNWMNFNRR